MKGEKQRARRLNSEEQSKLLAALNKDSRRHILHLIILDLHTGLRQGELLRLRIDDIDFANNTISVTHTKTDEDREVEMNQTARNLLEHLVENAQSNEYEYLFTNPQTGTHYKVIKTAFNAARREAQIVDFRFHDLRHCFASRAGNDPNVSISALAETLGHKNWKTTIRYTHAAKEGKKRVVEAVESHHSAEIGDITVTREKRQAS